MPAGEIYISLYHQGGRAKQTRIVSRRPEAAKALTGKTPEQVLALVPLLFSICGKAQAYAALIACRAALSLPAEPELDAAREMLVQLETLREHAWRMLLDWPAALGLQANKPALASLMKFDNHFKQDLFADGAGFGFASRLHRDLNVNLLLQKINDLTRLIDSTIFQGQLAAFLTISNETQLHNWLSQNTSFTGFLLSTLYRRDWMSAGNNPIACLPELDHAALHVFMQHEDLSALSRQPHWLGMCMETTALNRQYSHPLLAELQTRYGNGLLVRLVANLIEVARIPGELTGKPTFPAKGFGSDGIGIAQVQAARGLLIHRLVLRQGRVYDYRIVAPTEWNFHPHGVVAQGLQNLHVPDAVSLKQQADLFIKAVDPCVKYHLTLTAQTNETQTHA